MHLNTKVAAAYLVSLLNISDLLSSGRVVGGERFPADRVHELVVDEDLKKKKKPQHDLFVVFFYYTRGFSNCKMPFFTEYSPLLEYCQQGQISIIKYSP